MAVPEFPPPFVIDRVRSLGYGTGPWQREQLVGRWGAPTADKFIGDAKAAGWLISPLRGIYYVPAAQDLTVVSWLPEPARSEFLVSRTLSAARIPYWCLSAWARERGLEMGQPAFVTDLGVRDASSRRPSGKASDRKLLRETARAVAQGLTSVPFLENLVIVPLLPPTSDDALVREVLVPEDASNELRRKRERTLGEPAVQLVDLAFSLLLSRPPDPARAAEVLNEMERKQRGIRYAVGPRVDDAAWAVALLASLGTPRIEELVTAQMSKTRPPDGGSVQRWAGLIGPPQPNTAWKEALTEGPFPYLLAPPFLWSEMGADQAARRFRMLDGLRS